MSEFSVEAQPEAGHVISRCDSFRTLAVLEDIDICVNMQGMAMTEDTIYAFKVARNNSRSVLHRIDKQTGRVERMTDLKTGCIFIDYLCHANDATLAELDGELHMFVATMAQGDMTLVELRILPEGFERVANYALRKEDGELLDISAVEILKQEGSRLTMLFNKRDDNWIGTLDMKERAAELPIRFFSTFDTHDIPFKGQKSFLDVDVFFWQGITARGGKLYVPRTHGQDSVFIVYDMEQEGPIWHCDPCETFTITDLNFDKLEAEGLGFDAAGRLYFNTNRRNKGIDAPHFDGIHVINRMVF